jgi:hypothetical protein
VDKGNKTNQGERVTGESRAASQRAAAKEAWVKPEITSFKPVTAARGISYNRGDGLTNLTP